MAWLRSPENPLFAKAFVNRVWASYFNVGIVNPPDDMNLANPPSNAPLLNYLAEQFIANKFDMKWLHREILNSRTYQLSWQPNATNRLDERNFARAVPRRLAAEIAWDMVSQAVSNDEKFASYTTSLKDRAIALPGAGQRYASQGGSGYALAIFGRSIRESNCDCDRSEEPSLLQTIFLRNDGQVLSMLDGRDGWLAQIAKANGLKLATDSQEEAKRDASRKSAMRKAYAGRLKAQKQLIAKAVESGNKKAIEKAEARLQSLKDNWIKSTSEVSDEAPAKSEIDIASAIEDAYLRTLSRRPNENEMEVATQFVADAKDQLDGLRGVMWALLNTKEFIVNH